MAILRKLSISRVATRLDKPFAMINVARVGDIVLSVYLCQGALEWHRHLDNDELFWVHEGTILLESDWGRVRLRSGELSVVPKGIKHRSSAGSRASVLLLRCGFFPGRKNGRRRLYSADSARKQRRVSLQRVVRSLSSPFTFRTVAWVEDSVVQAAWGQGTWPVEIPTSRDVLFFVLKGTATVRTSESMLHLHPGDLTVAPKGAIYQLSTTQETGLVRVTREDEQKRPAP